MSEPTRYRVANNQAQLTLGGNILAVDPAGPLIEYTDYARLHSQFANSEQENARLKAEVERLRKAGDEMYMTLVDNNSHFEEVWRDKRIYAREAFQGWNHAKEGKQS
ncbi:hypothetical protein UFOVP1233_28 [uncultured Caudovirales phage]|uniref:Uncharacterized protein n=1 Tax=uncultured Caudovirales phage TaxID=2100421 RepID=A0A6J5R4T2_9CAUD|nr:hypothetical protein UFOVP1233_28 [uncultured Caudovirales phage]